MVFLKGIIDDTDSFYEVSVVILLPTRIKISLNSLSHFLIVAPLFSRSVASVSPHCFFGSINHDTATYFIAYGL